MPLESSSCATSTVHRSQFTVLNSPFSIHRSQFIVLNSPFSVRHPQFITQPSSQANLSGSVSNRHSLVSPTLGRHLHSCLGCEIVSIHSTQAYMWAMNNISRCGTVCHLLLPLMSCPRGITGSLSPLPEPRSWACKGVFWSSTTLCKTPQHKHIPPSFATIFCPDLDIEFISGASVYQRPNEILLLDQCSHF